MTFFFWIQICIEEKIEIISRKASLIGGESLIYVYNTLSEAFD